MTSPKSLIINSPYDSPQRHWQQGTGTQLNLVEGRRAARRVRIRRRAHIRSARLPLRSSQSRRSVARFFASSMSSS